MSSQASLPPKERVNIRYVSAIGDAKEDVELPLKLLVVGDFTQKEDETPIEDRQLVNVDKDNFNDVMRSHQLGMEIAVKNTLAGDGTDELPVSLNFHTLKDFEPDSVAEQVPALKSLLELREALNALRSPLGNLPSFRKKIEALLDDPQAREKLLGELNATIKG